MTEPSLARLIIWFLGAVAVLGLVAVVALVWRNTESAAVTAVVALVGPAIGALGTLATTRTGPQPEEQLASLVGERDGRASAVDDLAALADGTS